MKCKLIGHHLRVFSKAIRLLSKFRDYVHIVCDQNGINFRILKEYKNGFIEVLFGKRFFFTYECQEFSVSQLSLRSLILVFRIINIDKIVESCTIIINNQMPKVVFRMVCKRGVTREYFLPYMESDILRYSSTNERTPTLRADSKLLSEAVQHFAQNTKEITLWLFSDEIQFKTYIEDENPNYDDLPMTSFAYKSREFSFYNFIEEISVTFCVNDLKSFLEFASYQNQMVEAFFEASGKPIEFKFDNKDEFYSAKLILATFHFPDDELPQPPSNHLSRTSISLIGSSETPNNDINENNVSNCNEFHESNHMPSNHSNPSYSGFILNNFSNNSNNNLQQENIANNETADEDLFDDDEEFEQMLTQLPNFSCNESNDRSQTENESVFVLSGSPLRRYHQNFLFGNEEDDNPVISSQDILVPDSDEEQV